MRALERLEPGVWSMWPERAAGGYLEKAPAWKQRLLAARPNLMLRVVHLSTTDVSGGAALATHRLYQVLPDRADSTLFVASKRGRDAGVVEFKPALGAASHEPILFRAARHFQRNFLRAANGTFMTRLVFFGGLVERQLPPADVFHLHFRQQTCWISARSRDWQLAHRWSGHSTI